MRISSCGNRVIVTYEYQHYLDIKYSLTKEAASAIEISLNFMTQFFKDDTFKPEKIEITYQRGLIINVDCIDPRIEILKPKTHIMGRSGIIDH